MSLNKRHYSVEFKEEAVELAKTVGITKAGSELGINPKNINRWRAEGKKSPLTGEKSKQALEKEVKQLQKENGYLKRINEVLKKSTAIFSKDQI